MNIVNSSMHFIAFLRRSDLPVDVSAVPAHGGPRETSAPGDVMAMVKKYISDQHLSQPPFQFLRAGASMLLPSPSGPPTWLPRIAFTDEDDAGFERLSEKVAKYMRSKMAALQYLRDWRNKPRVPEAVPPAPILFSHTCGSNGASWRAALEQAVCSPVDDFQLMSVKRRRVSAGRRIDMPLHEYLLSRTAQGIAVEQAVEEWNGGQLVQSTASGVGRTA